MHDVLVIDDHVDSGKALVRLLCHAGFDASHESDPVRALARMTTQPPRVVLLDWMMPVMNGGDVLRVMRQNERLNLVKVIIFTAGEAAALRDAQAASPLQVLRKGFSDPAKIVQAVTAALGTA
jgi:CheY-like chemotaxis protein